MLVHPKHMFVQWTVATINMTPVTLYCGVTMLDGDSGKVCVHYEYVGWPAITSPLRKFKLPAQSKGKLVQSFLVINDRWQLECCVLLMK